jgi:hypothetical protein
MLGTESLLVDRQRVLVQGFGVVVAALGAV